MTEMAELVPHKDQTTVAEDCHMQEENSAPQHPGLAPQNPGPITSNLSQATGQDVAVEGGIQTQSDKVEDTLPIQPQEVSAPAKEVANDVANDVEMDEGSGNTELPAEIHINQQNIPVDKADTDAKMADLKISDLKMCVDTSAKASVETEKGIIPVHANSRDENDKSDQTSEDSNPRSPESLAPIVYNSSNVANGEAQGTTTTSESTKAQAVTGKPSTRGVKIPAKINQTKQPGAVNSDDSDQDDSSYDPLKKSGDASSGDDSSSSSSSQSDLSDNDGDELDGEDSEEAEKRKDKGGVRREASMDSEQEGERLGSGLSRNSFESSDNDNDNDSSSSSDGEVYPDRNRRIKEQLAKKAREDLQKVEDLIAYEDDLDDDDGEAEQNQINGQQAGFEDEEYGSKIPFGNSSSSSSDSDDEQIDIEKIKARFKMKKQQDSFATPDRNRTGRGKLSGDSGMYSGVGGAGVDDDLMPEDMDMDDLDNEMHHMEDDIDDDMDEEMREEQIQRMRRSLMKGLRNADDDSDEDDNGGNLDFDPTQKSHRERSIGDIMGDDQDEEEEDDSFDKILGKYVQKSRSAMNQNVGSHLTGFQRKPFGKKVTQPAITSPSRDNLDSTYDTLRLQMNQFKKMQIVTAIKDREFAYLKELQAVFEQLDEKREEEKKKKVEENQLTEIDNESSLNDDRIEKMALIVKQIFIIGEPTITDALLGEQLYKFTFGALEMLPEIKGKLNCREFFDSVRYKKVIPLPPMLLRKIHVCYRATYLRETIFAKDEQQGPQSLAFITFNYSMEVLTTLMNNFEHMDNIINRATDLSLNIESRADAIQFLMEIVNSFKQYQQMINNYVQLRGASIADVLLRKLNYVSVIKKFFLEDSRVQKIQEQLFGKEGVAEGQETQEVQNESEALDPEKFTKPHNRFSDKMIYDIILTQLIEITNVMVTTNPKEVITAFLNDKDITMILAQHVFFAPEEALRSQIIDLFRTLLDLSGIQVIQNKVEQLIIRALLKPFLLILKKTEQEANKHNEMEQDEGASPVVLLKIDSVFKNQAQFMFEFMQLVCKPQVNALVAEPRQGVTPIITEFVKQFGLARLTLGVFAEESNDTLTRLMAIKFFRSLLALSNQDDEILHDIIRLEPLNYCRSIFTCDRVRAGRLNMLHSATFDFINVFGVIVYEKMSVELHRKLVNQHQNDFDEIPGIVDKFLYPVASMKKTRLQEAESLLKSAFGQSSFCTAKKILDKLQGKNKAQKMKKVSPVKPMENKQQEEQGDFKWSLRDLILRDFDNDDLAVTQVMGRKRSYSESESSKKKQMAPFKFVSKSDEKVPKQPSMPNLEKLIKVHEGARSKSVRDDGEWRWSSSEDEKLGEECTISQEEAKVEQVKPRALPSSAPKQPSGESLISFYINEGKKTSPTKDATASPVVINLANPGGAGQIEDDQEVAKVDQSASYQAPVVKFTSISDPPSVEQPITNSNRQHSTMPVPLQPSSETQNHITTEPSDAELFTASIPLLSNSQTPTLAGPATTAEGPTPSLGATPKQNQFETASQSMSQQPQSKDSKYHLISLLDMENQEAKALLLSQEGTVATKESKAEKEKETQALLQKQTQKQRGSIASLLSSQ